MSKYLDCPICGEGNLHAHQQPDTIAYEGKSQYSVLHYSECDTCGSETATKEQLRTNQRIMNAFKKEVDGLLSAIEIKNIRTNLGLTIKQAGKVFGGGPVAFSKYENDELVHSQPMDAALRLAQYNPLAAVKLAHSKGIHTSSRYIPTQVYSPNSSGSFVLYVKNSPTESFSVDSHELASLLTSPFFSITNQNEVQNGSRKNYNYN